MDPEDRHVVRLAVRVDSDEERAALEQALLRAQASELSEVRRRETRLVAGYGDAVTRESMTGELARARSRWTMLERLLAALHGPSSED